MPKLIVGCGYLGTRVAQLWREAGEQVFATTRGRVEPIRALGIEPIVCDVLDPASLRGALGPVLQGEDLTVVYCVALDRSSGRTMREVYVNGLGNFLDVCPPAARFLYVSSTSIYGQVNGEVVDETAATEPQEESGRVVLAAETLLRERRPTAIVLRFAGIYGPGRLMRRQAIEAGTPIVCAAERWLNLIHVEDGAQLVLAAARAGELGTIYNVCDGQPVRRREFYGYLAELLGAAEPRFEAVPAGTPLPPHESSDRRIASGRLPGLGVQLAYPSYREGLRASI